MPTKRYSKDTDYEHKLALVMGRLGVEHYTFDWARSGSAWIDFTYKGEPYHFEHSVEKSKNSPEPLNFASDCFAQLVLTLIDLERMARRGIYDLQSFIKDMKALPAKAELPSCFAALDFTEMPDEATLRKRYRTLAKALHPDTGGDEAAFGSLERSFRECLMQIQMAGVE